MRAAQGIKKNTVTAWSGKKSECCSGWVLKICSSWTNRTQTVPRLRMFTRECVYKHSYADLCDLITYEEISDNVGALIVFCLLD